MSIWGLGFEKRTSFSAGEGRVYKFNLPCSLPKEQGNAIGVDLNS